MATSNPTSNSLLKSYQARQIKQYTTDLPQYVESPITSIPSENHYLQRLHLVRNQFAPGSTQYQFDSSAHSFYSSLYTPLVSTGNISSFSVESLYPTIQSFAQSHTIHRPRRHTTNPTKLSSTTFKNAPQNATFPQSSKPSNISQEDDEESAAQLQHQLVSPGISESLFNRLKTSINAEMREICKEEAKRLNEMYIFETGNVVSMSDERILNLDDILMTEMMRSEEEEDDQESTTSGISYNASIGHKKQLLRNEMALQQYGNTTKRGQHQNAREKKKMLESIVGNVFGSALASSDDPPRSDLSSTTAHYVSQMNSMNQGNMNDLVNLGPASANDLFSLDPSSANNLFDPNPVDDLFGMSDGTQFGVETDHTTTAAAATTGQKRKQMSSLLDGLQDEIYDIEFDAAMQTNTFDIGLILSTAKVYKDKPDPKSQLKHDLLKKQKDEKEIGEFVQSQGYLTEEQQKNVKRQRILDIE